MEDYYCTPAEFYQIRDQQHTQGQQSENQLQFSTYQPHQQALVNKSVNNKKNNNKSSNPNLNEIDQGLLRNNLLCDLVYQTEAVKNNNCSSSSSNSFRSECIIQNSGVNINYTNNNSNNNSLKKLQEDNILKDSKPDAIKITNQGISNNLASTTSVIYAMDRLSPYGNTFEYSTANISNLYNLTLYKLLEFNFFYNPLSKYCITIVQLLFIEFFLLNHFIN
jgi:hypothetical protein